MRDAVNYFFQFFPWIAFSMSFIWPPMKWSSFDIANYSLLFRSLFFRGSKVLKWKNRPWNVSFIEVLHFEVQVWAYIYRIFFSDILLIQSIFQESFCAIGCETLMWLSTYFSIIIIMPIFDWIDINLKNKVLFKMI